MIVLSSRDYRALVTGGSAIVALVFGGKVLPTSIQWQRSEVEEARRARANARRAEAELAAEPSRRRSISIARSALLSADTAFISAATPSEATAELGAYISSLADSAQLQVGALQLRSDLPRFMGCWRVGLRVSLTGDLQSLAAFLAALEQGAPLVAVRELSILQPDPMLPSEKTEVLQIEIAVEALARHQEETP